MLDAQLTTLYKECHSHAHHHLSEGAADGWDAIVERIAQGLHDGTLKPEDLDEATLKRVAKELMKAVFDGAGTNFDDPDITGDQTALLQKFEENVYYFSGFKNYQQLKESNALLLDEDRNIRPFAEFKKLVKEINTKYNVNYLQAEYGHAVASAQMGTKWQQIQSEKDILPFLQLDAVMDERTTTVCRSIDGVTERVDHPFWKIYYPPNHWGCRDTVRQLDDATPTPAIAMPHPDLLPMFRNNVGVDQVVFPANHPYMNVPKKVKIAVKKKVDPTIPKRNAS